MSCDSYYSIGGKHQVCQDYALHGTLDSMEYAIVADGCSSADHSEIGAQILCHAAKYQIAFCYKSGLFDECSIDTLSAVLGNSIFKRVNEIRKSYPISRKALEATLLITLYAPPFVYFFGWGDGVVITKAKGEHHLTNPNVWDIDFTGNAPLYLACDLDNYLQGLREKGFDEPKKTRTVYDLKDGVDESPVLIEDAITDKKPFRWRAPASEIESVTICSDGVKSFKDEDKKSVDLVTLIPEIIGYRSTEGEFVKKRMFFLNRKARNNNWSHYDDISCGTIII